MTELANWVAGAPTPMPANYNARRRLWLHPYDPRRDPRADTPTGVPRWTPAGRARASARLRICGRQTSAPKLQARSSSPRTKPCSPAIKPTVGRMSRWGVIPITADQDTAGPMARTVTDAAILLGALEGTAPDPNDAATIRCTPPPGTTTPRS